MTLSKPYKKEVVLLIPAYKPDAGLELFVRELQNSGFRHVIIVDDGGGQQYHEIFSSLKSLPGCIVLHHGLNLGKGRAIKTGMDHFLQEFGDAAGLITVDADGQHKVPDILKIKDSLVAHPSMLILGARTFESSIPLRSKIGNKLTRLIFKLISGYDVPDTQTGLRGIPARIVPALLELSGERYEYEMNMLLSAKRLKLKIKNEPIETVYISANSGSHFNPIVDSMKIYFVILRFALSSLFATLIDVSIFTICYKFLTTNVLIDISVGRVVSSTANFAVNRSLVFDDTKGVTAKLIKYYLLVVFLMLLSYACIKILSSRFGLHPVLAKILAETMLFFASFSIQRDFIFVDKDQL